MVLGAAALGLSGCAWLRDDSPGGDLRAVSTDRQTILEPRLITGVYRYFDPNTADVYLSDIPAARLANLNDPLTGVSGSIVHLHIFLVPYAGSTPIDSTACNITIQNLVLSGRTDGVPPMPVMGLYAGGGFLLPDGDVGDNRIGGSVDLASHRIYRYSPGFSDRLGTGALEGRFSAKLDDATARKIDTRLESLINTLPPAPVADPQASPDRSLKIPTAKADRAAPGATKPDSTKPNTAKPDAPKPDASAR